MFPRKEVGDAHFNNATVLNMQFSCKDLTALHLGLRCEHESYELVWNARVNLEFPIEARFHEVSTSSQTHECNT